MARRRASKNLRHVAHIVDYIVEGTLSRGLASYGGVEGGSSPLRHVAFIVEGTRSPEVLGRWGLAALGQ